MFLLWLHSSIVEHCCSVKRDSAMLLSHSLQREHLTRTQFTEATIMSFIDEIVAYLAYLWHFLFALPQLLDLEQQANDSQSVYPQSAAPSFGIIEGRSV